MCKNINYKEVEEKILLPDEEREEKYSVDTEDKDTKEKRKNDNTR